MAFLLGCEKVKVDFPTKEVFDGLSLGVDTGDRIGIVGRNGDGKSTLLKLLAGEVTPDEGRVIKTGGVSIGLLSQRDHLDDALSVQDAVMGDRPVYEWAKDATVRGIFEGLLYDIALDRPVGQLSGGQRRRVDLARLLAGQWDILMLDEPTNHLDMAAITWLANHLKTRWKPGEGALLVVTHDRWFLDEVCTSMWEVYRRSVSSFEGGFSAYVMKRVERDRQEESAERKRQNLLRRELAWLSRGAQARSTKPKFHVAAARTLIADVPELRNPIELKRMAMARLGKKVLELEDATLMRGDRAVLSDVTWLIGPGDRFGIVGENGAGKTTLLEVLADKLPLTRGKLVTGQTVKLAYLTQHLEFLDEYENDRVRQVVGRYQSRIMLDGKESTPAQLLENLGFSSADLNERVGDLSGGQKRRLGLMLILLDEPNVIILDEPGNDLDVDMLAAVENLLDGWPGTLILVTHDRYLMEHVTDHQYALIGGHLRHLPGGIDEFIDLVSVANKHEDQVLKSIAADKPASDESSDAPKLSAAQVRLVKKAMVSLEGKIGTVEKKIAQKKEELGAAPASDFEALMAIQVEVDELEARKMELEEQWLEEASKLEEG